MRGIYNQAEHLPERIRMMQAWADHLDRLRAGVDTRTPPPNLNDYPTITPQPVIAGQWQSIAPIQITVTPFAGHLRERNGEPRPDSL